MGEEEGVRMKERGGRETVWEEREEEVEKVWPRKRQENI